MLWLIAMQLCAAMAFATMTFLWTVIGSLAVLTFAEAVYDYVKYGRKFLLAATFASLYYKISLNIFLTFYALIFFSSVFVITH